MKPEATTDSRHSRAARPLGVNVLSSSPETFSVRMTRLARRLMRAPTAELVVDFENRQDRRDGLGFPHTSHARRALLNNALLRVGIDSTESLVIADSRAHTDVTECAALAHTGVMACLGTTLADESGHVLGRLFIWDQVPRDWNHDDLDSLRDLGAWVVAEAAVQRDRAERMRTEERLRESDARFRTFMEHLPAVAFIKDDEGRYVWGNPAWARQHPECPDGPLGKTDAELWPEETAQQFRASDRAALSAGQTVEMAESSAAAQGSPLVHWLTLKFPVTSHTGTPQIGGIVIDVTALKDAEDALQAARREIEASEHRYHSLAEAIPQIVWTAKPDGTTDYCNRQWAEYTGLDVTTALGRGWLQAIHPDDRAGAVRAWETAQATGAGYEFENRVRRADDTYRWHLTRAVPIRGHSERVIAWFGTSTDIDDRKRAELTQTFLAEAGRTLASSLDFEKTLDSVARLVVPHLADWCIIDMADEGGVLRRFSIAHTDPARVAQAWDFSERYPTNMNATCGPAAVFRSGRSLLLHEVAEAQLAAYAQDDVHLAFLHELQFRSVMCVPLLARGRALGTMTLLTAESGRRFGPSDLEIAEELTAFAALAVDNARLYRDAQAALRSKHEALRLIDTLFDNAPVGLAFLDRDLRYLRINRALADINGVAPEDHIGKTMEDLLPAPLYGKLRPMLQRVLQTGETARDLELHGETNADPGVSHDWLIRHYAVRDADGSIIGTGAVVLDITDRKTDERELQAAKEAAESANRAKDRFLAILSHELRTPLTPVLAAVSAPLGHLTDHELRAELEMIRRNITLEARLIEDLLDLSRIEHGQLRLNLEPIDVNDAIRQAVAVCRDEILVSGLQVSLELEAEEHYAIADHARVIQIAWNLVHNAAKFTQPGALLTVRTRNSMTQVGDRERMTLIAEFSDNGPGIDPDVLPRIFEAFERGPAGHGNRQGGLGLGLAICRNLAEAQGGRLTVNCPGRDLGTTFLLELATTPAPSPKPAAVPSVVASDQPRPVKVLLVEDNEDTLRYLYLVMRQRGYAVRTASDLSSARRQAASSDFDLLISDIELPDGTGLELMRELAVRGIPGIAMSGYGSEDDVRQSRDAGFAAHLTKPIDSGRLQETMLRLTANVS